MKENGPVDVLISDQSCFTLCVGIIGPPLFFMSVYAEERIGF